MKADPTDDNRCEPKPPHARTVHMFEPDAIVQLRLSVIFQQLSKCAPVVRPHEV